VGVSFGVWGLGSMVPDDDILEGLDEAALDVACLRRFDGRVNQTLTATHGVEVHLLWCETLRAQSLR
jgi:hypothetical protein